MRKSENVQSILKDAGEIEYEIKLETQWKQFWERESEMEQLYVCVRVREGERPQYVVLANKKCHCYKFN